ncbi:MAG: hypothetical protein IPP40_17025, partial [bacterium]|nr:hypothetical protein [bacterium]
FVMDGFGVSGLDACVFVSEYAGGVSVLHHLRGLADKFGKPRMFVATAGDAGRCVLFADAAHAGLCFADGTGFIEDFSYRRAVDILSDCGCSTENRSKAMGIVGAAITLVALGSPIGGWLGSMSPVYSLSLGGVLMVLVGLASVAVVVPSQGLAQRQPVSAILKLLTRAALATCPYLFAFLDRFTVGFSWHHSRF